MLGILFERSCFRAAFPGDVNSARLLATAVGVSLLQKFSAASSICRPRENIAHALQYCNVMVGGEAVYCQLRFRACDVAILQHAKKSFCAQVCWGHVGISQHDQNRHPRISRRKLKILRAGVLEYSNSEFLFCT